MKTNLSRQKRFLRILCVLGAVLMMASSLVACGSSAVESENSYLLMYSHDMEEYTVLKNGKPIGDPIDSQDASIRPSLDGSAALVLTEDHTLYAVSKKKKVVDVAEDVDYAIISANGESIAYISDEELFLYNVKKDRSTKISDYGMQGSFCFSPDGKTLAYTDNYGVLYLHRDGKQTKFERDCSPVAISDKAEIVYYLNRDKGTYYARTDGEDTKLGEYDEIELYFNADHTEAAYLNGDSLYILSDGSKKEKIATSVESFCEGIDGTYAWDGTLPLQTFVGQYALKEDGTLIYINKEFSADKIAYDVSEVLLSADGKVCYYTVGKPVADKDETMKVICPSCDNEVEVDLSSDSVYVDCPRCYENFDYRDVQESDSDWDEDLLSPTKTLYRIAKPGKEGEKVAKDSFLEIFITSDGSACYYLNQDWELHYVKGAEEATEVADDVFYAVLSHDDHLMFIHDVDADDSIGTLSYSKKGKAPEKIADDVFMMGLLADAHTVYYVTDMDLEKDFATIYVASKGVKFSKLGEEIMLDD